MKQPNSRRDFPRRAIALLGVSVLATGALILGVVIYSAASMIPLESIREGVTLGTISDLIAEACILSGLIVEFALVLGVFFLAGLWAKRIMHWGWD